ncbi:MAG: hypothetical protein IPI15_19300 [Saprospiraceae bacterium]|uniref:hypothetical protein n=1 Tax=Candidatus Brachybacter algidus TaxID=2982024 RepID=UPI002580B6F5|nr:hypothetical protein [Candidatus Brachybacter algidus]MBK7605665.1 hypothetical protein [Candidatus Brachybacter algidus]
MALSSKDYIYRGRWADTSLMYLTNEQLFSFINVEKYENEVPVFKYFPDLNDCLQGGGAVDELFTKESV